MIATKISPPPVQPPVTINIEMNEREAALLMCCMGRMDTLDFKTRVDEAGGIRDGYIPSPDLDECDAFNRDLFYELKDALK